MILYFNLEMLTVILRRYMPKSRKTSSSLFSCKQMCQPFGGPTMSRALSTGPTCPYGKDRIDNDATKRPR